MSTDPTKSLDDVNRMIAEARAKVHFQQRRFVAFLGFVEEALETARTVGTVEGYREAHEAIFREIAEVREEL